MSQEERSKLVDSFMARINGDVSKKDIILEQINFDKKVMTILKSMYNMSQSESWDESDAQDLIMCGAKLYLEIKNNT